MLGAGNPASAATLTLGAAAPHVAIGAGILSSSTGSVTLGNSAPGPIVVDGATQLTGEVSVTPPLIDLSPGTGSDIPGGVVVLNEGHVDPVVLGTLESVLVGLTVSSGGSPVSLSGISLLGEKERLHFDDEAELLRQLRPGTDGLVISEGTRRATFLPRVWVALPEPERFLHHLKMKAGMPDGHWSNRIEAWRYTVEEF
jgi:hypothetical protein